jgi:hypothetical protein
MGVSGRDKASGIPTRYGGASRSAKQANRDAPCGHLAQSVPCVLNQIQVLALRLAQLDDDNQRLHARLEHAGDNITALPARR